MPARLKVTLTLSEDKTLKELELANQVPRRTKKRASILRLNSRGKTVEEIALYVKCASSTVRQTIHRWQQRGLAGLWESQGNSSLDYGYAHIGQQKSITQNKNRGRRINIMGVWEDKQTFDYALKVGTYKAKNYVQFMDAQAEKAIKRLFDTGKYTVIVQDNSSIHRANILKERVEIWEKQGLILFSLPPYSPEMNLIEVQWRRADRLMSSKTTTGGFSNRALRRQELAGGVFDDQYDLALAIIQGLENRGKQGNFSVERLMFN